MFAAAEVLRILAHACTHRILRGVLVLGLDESQTHLDGIEFVGADAADEDLFVPGFEYHLTDDSVDPPELISQIPTGYAGEMSLVEPGRANASAWLDALPVVKEFRRKFLGRA